MASIEEIKDERGKLRKFITTYHDLPVLWDVRSSDYTKKDKRNKAYEILLHVFRAIKADATIEDVKKKINSMRSNYRKELKKVIEAANVGMDYRPSSWMYEELMFLKDLESCASWVKTPSYTAPEDPDTVRNQPEQSQTENDLYTAFSQYTMKRPRFPEAKSVEPPPVVCNSMEGLCDNESDIAKVWAQKLKFLDHMQRLFAEKAINDVLFEAQLGTLHRNSVKINEFALTSSQTTSVRRNYQHHHHRMEHPGFSPEYKYSESEVFRPDDN